MTNLMASPPLLGLVEWGSVPDWITAGSSVLGVLGLFLLWKQLIVAEKGIELGLSQINGAAEQMRLYLAEINAEHQRFLKQNAVAATAAFVNQGPPAAQLARKIVEHLGVAECKLLEKQEGLRVPLALRREVLGCLVGVTTESELEKADRTKDDQYLQLTPKEVGHIRWLIITYLSQLEVALMTWHYKTAEPRIIEEQFEELVCPRSEKPILETYRQETGGNLYYPALSRFIEEVQRKRRPGDPPAVLIPTAR
jgi:hypothetical protein